jgi:transcriptional regulator with XRE-family HTH domain
MSNYGYEVIHNNQRPYYNTKPIQKTRKLDYMNIYQKARIDKGYTQEKASEMIGKSIESLKAYESGKTKPSAETIKRMADVYEAKYLYATYLNQDEIIKQIIPPVKANQSPEKNIISFIKSFREFTPFIDELFNVANGTQISDKFYELFGAVVSDGLALQFAKSN